MLSFDGFGPAAEVVVLMATVTRVLVVTGKETGPVKRDWKWEKRG